jgi:gamma-glutamylcyclotransferase (GGCT)/AIG2-like uncharacterized protein YtfP
VKSTWPGQETEQQIISYLIYEYPGDYTQQIDTLEAIDNEIRERLKHKNNNGS